MRNRTVLLVSGPSSSGKSEFIARRGAGVVEVEQRSEPVFAYELMNRPSAVDETSIGQLVLHYNVLRAADLYVRESPWLRVLRRLERLVPRLRGTRLWSALARVRSAAVDRAARRFRTDEAWNRTQDLLNNRVVEAVVLVTPLSELKERLAFRRGGEPTLADDPGYNRTHWVNLVGMVDLERLMQTWIEELQSVGVSVRLVLSTCGRFVEIPVSELGGALRSEATGTQTRYSKAEIVHALQANQFGYHSVPLPYGLQTPGDMRFDIVDLVLPRDLSGRSVLDIGCAYGAVCFDAEQRGADHVKGTELKPERLRGAMLLRDILDSDVCFTDEDVLSDPVHQTYDIVLLLNVIHHVPNPIAALQRVLELADTRVVIEFPTFFDPKFPSPRRHRRFRRALNNGPFIGVSSPAVDQTFIFAPMAIARLFREHLGFQGALRIEKSPIAGRSVLIADLTV